MELRNVFILFSLKWAECSSQKAGIWKPGSADLTHLRGLLTAGLDSAPGTGGRRGCRSGMTFFFFFPRVLYSAYHLLISHFLLAGLMAHQPAFAEMNPQEALARGFAAESFVVS